MKISPVKINPVILPVPGDAANPITSLHTPPVSDNLLLKRTLSTRNRRIKKLLVSLLAAEADMQTFRQEQDALTEELKDSNRSLIKVNQELALQNAEKEKRAAELIIANNELAFQNEEKEKRAAELVIANKELAFQNKEKEKRAQELITANDELIFHNAEKEKRAAELITANIELVFQNKEKEKRAAELVLANKELAFQNTEKEKRAAELVLVNREGCSQANLRADTYYCHANVTDNGIGFEPQYKDRIFEVFEKLHSQKEYAGTGIGLAIVKKIVENHHGIITASGVLGEGARFDIYIPVVQQ